MPQNKFNQPTNYYYEILCHKAYDSHIVPPTLTVLTERRNVLHHQTDLLEFLTHFAVSEKNVFFREVSCKWRVELSYDPRGLVIIS